MLGPTIETDRLILRPPIADDFEGWAAFGADALAQRFLGGVQPRSVMWRQFTTHAGSWALYGYGMFSVIEKATGAWMGRLGPHKPEGWPGTEVGWSLLPRYWGHGFALEGSAAAMDFAADRLGWTDIIHCINPDNAPSIALAERLGSKRRHAVKMPAPLQDAACTLWGQSADEWRARKR